MFHFLSAIAASAPVAWFQNLTSCGAYTESVTKSFIKESKYCAANIKTSWSIMDEKAKTGDNLLIA